MRKARKKGDRLAGEVGKAKSLPKFLSCRPLWFGSEGATNDLRHGLGYELILEKRRCRSIAGAGIAVIMMMKPAVAERTSVATRSCQWRSKLET